MNLDVTNCILTFLNLRYPIPEFKKFVNRNKYESYSNFAPDCRPL